MLGVFFAFSGRIGRRDFWVVTMTGALVLLASLLLPAWEMIAIHADGNLPVQDRNMAMISYAADYVIGNIAVIGIVWGLVLWSNMAAIFKRLHDLDHSGWSMTAVSCAGMLPYIGPLVSFGFFVWCGAMPGTAEANRFGEMRRSLFAPRVEEDDAGAVSADETPIPRRVKPRPDGSPGGFGRRGTVREA